LEIKREGNLEGSGFDLKRGFEGSSSGKGFSPLDFL